MASSKSQLHILVLELKIIPLSLPIQIQSIQFFGLIQPKVEKYLKTTVILSVVYEICMKFMSRCFRRTHPYKRF